MVNKRFNRKFRRALGAALGALAVSSISNIETIGAAFTETSLAADAQIGWLCALTKSQKEAIYTKIQNELEPQKKYGIRESGILRNINFGFAMLNGADLSFPIFYRGGINNWEGAWTVTISHPHHPSVRVTIIKTKAGLDSALDPADYLLAPAMSENEFRNYINTHNVPWKGNWIKAGDPRPAARAHRLRKIVVDAHGVHNEIGLGLFRFIDRHLYEPRYYPLQNTGVPLGAFPAIPGGYTGDVEYLTRWGQEGLIDVSIWNKILGDQANIYKMYYDIITCPPELRSFYYPEEKTEETTTPYRDSASAPVITPPTTNMAPAIAALGVIPATIVLANQPAPTPAHVVANNNVTQGSNNAGAAPTAQNGALSSGSTDIGTASQTGSDVKLTSVKHDANLKSDSNEPSKTLKT